MARKNSSKKVIARLKLMRAFSIFVIWGMLSATSIYNDFWVLKLNQEQNLLVLGKLMSELDNQAILSLTNFTDFIQFEPAPTLQEKNRFSSLVTQQLPFIYTLTKATAYDKEALTAKISPNFILKQTNQFADGHRDLMPYYVQDFNIVTDFVYPLTAKTEPIIGLEVLSLDILDGLFAQSDASEFVRLLASPNTLNQTVVDAFHLFEGGYAISVLQSAGEVVVDGVRYPKYITSMLIELEAFKIYLAQLINTDNLRIGVPSLDQKTLWFGDAYTPYPLSINIDTQQVVNFLGRPITLQTRLAFGITNINWVLILFMTVLGIAAFLYFNQLYNVIKRKQTKLVQVNTKLTHNLKTQSDMLAYISHQLNTPLTLISLATHHLKRTPVEEKYNPYHLDTITAQTTKMSQLVTNILDVKTTERLALNPQMHELIAHLRHIIKPYIAQFKDNDIDAVINFSGIDHFDALYDQVSLELVVDNLLSNALKYTDKFEWVTIDLTYSTKRASTLVLTINNAHDLLTEDECEHIFTKFVRLNSETIAGNGLGLGVVKEICERNNWIITCTSSVLPEVSKKYGKDGCVSLQLVLPFG